VTAPTQIYAALAANAALSAVTGARLYPDRLPPADPQNPDARFPCVVYSIVGAPEGPHSHDGISGWLTPRASFACWAKTYAAAWELAELVLATLDTCGLGATPAGLVDLPEADTNLYRVIVDATIWTQISTRE